jgi:ribosomal protein S18 acetylase RimI-like enzyme
MTSTIRTGRLSDVEAVLSLWAAAGAEPSHTDDAKSVAKLIVCDPLALMVAEDNDQLVGSVIAGWDGWRGSIYRLAVAPSHRRLGLGTRLLHAAEARLSTTGAVRLQAIVADTEPTAVGYWRASGWEQQENRLRFVKG